MIQRIIKYLNEKRKRELLCFSLVFVVFYWLSQYLPIICNSHTGIFFSKTIFLFLPVLLFFFSMFNLVVNVSSKQK